ncbi:MAG TPA: hypothetical protein VL576_01485 [Candidatus Paceibacterota bacterium]|jgi:hypothetical protein|nr:hypothetical protein [Candidatus Paceibacterota bacterium]
MKKAIFNGSALTTLLAPALAFAQGAPNFNYVNSWLNQALYWLRLSITIIMILMFVFFLYNVFRFVMNKDPGKAADLRKVMINGLIGLFIATAVWGIIHLAGSITGVDTSGQTTSPDVTCPPGLDYNTATGTCGTNGF